MNPRVAQLALIIGGLAAACFLVGLVVCTILYGCAAKLPPEPSFVETVAATARDR